MPDLFNGDPLSLNRPDGFDFMAWLTKGTGGNNPHTYDAVDPIVEKAIKYLQEEKGIKKIGAVGYCFVSLLFFLFLGYIPYIGKLANRYKSKGAKYVARFLASGKGLSVGFVAHPSFVEEAELAAITGPFSIAAAETDQIFPAEKRHKSEEILKETKLPYQINLYSGTVHGFSVRCDLSKPVEKYAKEQAFIQAVTWFDTHLA